jgi:hypothetical protein
MKNTLKRIRRDWIGSYGPNANQIINSNIIIIRIIKKTVNKCLNFFKEFPLKKYKDKDVFYRSK